MSKFNMVIAWILFGVYQIFVVIAVFIYTLYILGSFAVKFIISIKNKTTFEKLAYLKKIKTFHDDIELKMV